MAPLIAWISYLNTGVLIGALALALFNASKDDVARNFAYFYALMSVIVIVSNLQVINVWELTTSIPQVYGYAVYQRRITMIRKRDPGHFGE